MKIFKDKHKLQKETFNEKRVSFVPTMGGLHKGHVSLIRRSKKFNRKILVSIFINPKQFNNKSDYNSYPRSQKNDIKLLKKLKIDYLYLPSYKDIYGFKAKNRVFLDKISKKLCGRFRRGHFEGVLNVVNRFLEIIDPYYIFMGKKDYQQLYLIKKHIKKKNIKSKLVECETIREKNGIAYSTRNLKLNKKQKDAASNIYHYLLSVKKNIKKKKNFLLLKSVKKKLLDLGADKIEYIEVFNTNNFIKPKNSKYKFNIFVAYYIKKIRLIDNI